LNNYETIIVEESKSTVKIILNRIDKANAINNKMSTEIVEVITSLKDRPDIRYIVFTGNGSTFSAGADMHEAAEVLENTENLNSFIHKDQLDRRNFMQLIESMEQITIASINGAAYGAGFALAMACDFRVMATSAIICLPESERGMFFSAGCTPRLVSMIGYTKSMELLLLSQKVDADESLRIGLVTSIAEENQLNQQVEKIIKQLEKSTPEALKTQKRLIQSSVCVNNQATSLEANSLELLMLKNNVTGQMKQFKK